jgi:hypothetical protein
MSSQTTIWNIETQLGYEPAGFVATHTDWYEWRETTLIIFIERIRSEIAGDSTISAYLDGIAVVDTDDLSRYDVSAAFDKNLIVIWAPNEEITPSNGRDDRHLSCKISVYTRDLKGLDDNGPTERAGGRRGLKGAVAQQLLRERRRAVHLADAYRVGGDTRRPGRVSTRGKQTDALGCWASLGQPVLEVGTMLKVKYTGEEVLDDHPTGRWEPDEVREIGRSCAVALVRERADMELVEDDPKPKAKPKPRKGKAGGEDE